MGKNNLILTEAPFKKEIEKASEEELAKRLREAHEAKQKEIKEKAEKLELLPNGNRVVLMPYPSNPYVEILTESGIYIETSEFFLNPDSGSMEKKEELVSCAKVLEVGPECKYVAKGDDVYYDTRTAYPLPFMSQGYKITSEPQIIAILNEGLKDRINGK